MQMWGFCGRNNCGYKCSLQSHALWTWRGWQSPRPFMPLRPDSVSMAAKAQLQPVLSRSCAAISCQAPCAWGATSNGWSIRNEEKLLEWKYLAWVPAGQSLNSSWPSSSRRYPIQQLSQMVCLRALWAPQRLLNGLSGVLNPQSWSENNTKPLESTRCSLHKYCFSRESERQTSHLTEENTEAWSS